VQHRNKVESTLLSKIVLARFLMLPLRTFDRLVTKTESSTWFSALRPWVSVRQVTGAQVAPDAVDSLPNQVDVQSRLFGRAGECIAPVASH